MDLCTTIQTLAEASHRSFHRNERNDSKRHVRHSGPALINNGHQQSTEGGLAEDRVLIELLAAVRIDLLSSSCRVRCCGYNVGISAEWLDGMQSLILKIVLATPAS